MSSGNWLCVLDDDDQNRFFIEMGEALAEAGQARSTEPLETCLREWKVTAGALSDPEVRTVLTSTLDGADFGEVSRP